MFLLFPVWCKYYIALKPYKGDRERNFLRQQGLVGKTAGEVSFQRAQDFAAVGAKSDSKREVDHGTVLGD